MTVVSPVLDRRRKAVVIVFALVILVSCAAIVSGVVELRQLNRVVAEEAVSDSGTSAIVRLVAALQIVLFVAAAVVFIRWLHLGYRNLDRLAPGVRRWGPGWAIGGWFVPLLNLWVPKMIFNDVWHGGASAPDDDDWPLSLARVWWLAFVFSNYIALRTVFNGSTPEARRDTTISFLISDSLDIVAALAGIAVVQAASRRLQRRMGAALEAATPDRSTR